MVNQTQEGQKHIKEGKQIKKECLVQLSGKGGLFFHWKKSCTFEKKKISKL